MITGDVRSLALQYCSTGTAAVKYRQYDLSAHFDVVPLWASEAMTYLGARFAGLAAPSSCGTIAPGNSLAPAATAAVRELTPSLG